ncbi:MAG: sugar ABC transporter substrate-binding protein, partial [Firmicutes bacterium]|nr:sugar ABC transporter substrate-binding protein [Bacillota bacterium]
TLLICDEDTTTAAKEVEAYLKKHPETDAFFFTGGWAFLGPPEAMPVYDQWCRNGGITVAMDTSYPVLQAAVRGFAQALVGQDYRKMGEFTVSYLVCAIKDLPIPSDFIDTGLELADETNFSQLLQTKKPWDIK